MSYTVHTPTYEGPFDLLLHLILKDEVDLYEIRLGDIVDAYLTELERLESLDLEVATEFLLIAATLIELKTRRLLPDDDRLDLDEELALWEERDLLLARLIECKTFKDAAVVLRRLELEAGRSHPRTAGIEERYIGLAPDLLEGVRPERLRDAFLRAVAPKPVPTLDLTHVTPIKVSVADAVVELLEDLPQLGRSTFRSLTSGLVDRIDVVVRFLAVLELFKQGHVELTQTATFGDIEVRWVGGPVTTDEALGALDVYEG